MKKNQLSLLVLALGGGLLIYALSKRKGGVQTLLPVKSTQGTATTPPTIFGGLKNQPITSDPKTDAKIYAGLNTANAALNAGSNLAKSIQSIFGRSGGAAGSSGRGKGTGGSSNVGNKSVPSGRYPGTGGSGVSAAQGAKIQDEFNNGRVDPNTPDYANPVDSSDPNTPDYANPVDSSGNDFGSASDYTGWDLGSDYGGASDSGDFSIDEG